MPPLYSIAILVILLVHIGYLTGFIKSLLWARTIGWSLAILATVLAHWITSESAPVFRMLAIITATLVSMKNIVLIEAYQGKPKLTYFQWIAFSTGWFGMRAQIFEKLFSTPLNDKIRLFLKGISRIVVGLFLLYLSVSILKKEDSYPLFSGLLALLGMSFILHFGILNISTAGWRLLGVDCRELFRSPGLSMSLKEFWGKRWNLAFSEMTAQIIYRPVSNRLGKGTAVFCAFLLSGILHEIAISVPVKSGYGLPLVYFCIHGLLMLAEDKILFVKKIVAHKIISRIWVFTWLILPMPLLFHKEFMGKIVFPLTNQFATFFFGF